MWINITDVHGNDVFLKTEDIHAIIFRTRTKKGAQICTLYHGHHWFTETLLPRNEVFDLLALNLKGGNENG